MAARFRSDEIASLLVVGLIIREAFSFWTGHPYDTEVWIRNAYYVSQGRDPYTLMAPVAGISFAYLNQGLPSVGYLPLWSLMLGAIYLLYSLLPGANRFVLYFLVKQPPVLGDLALGYLVYRALHHWGAAPDVAIKGLRFWVFFPYAVMISAIWGQFDAIVASLIVLSLLALGPWKRSIVDGLGILLKSLPLIFVPYNVFRGRGASRWSAVLALGIPALSTWLMFVIFGWDSLGISRMVTYSAHGNFQGLTYAAVVLSYASPLLSGAGGVVFYGLGLTWLFAVILVGFLAPRVFSGGAPRSVVQSFLLITAVFFLTRWEVNEQYLLYLLPLLFIDVTLWHPERKGLFRFTWILGLSFLLVNSVLLIRFVGPLYPPAVDFDYFINNFSAAALPRIIVMQALAIIFSIHMVQLVVILLRPGSNPVPWLWRLVMAARLGKPRRGENAQGEP